MWREQQKKKACKEQLSVIVRINKNACIIQKVQQFFFSKPPVKNFFSTNSSRPNSSRPTPHSRTLCASSCDLTELSSVDHSLHNCHPKRRRKTTTAVCLAHKLCSSTIWSEIIVSSHDKLKALKELQRKNNKESVWTVILNWWI